MDKPSFEKIKPIQIPEYKKISGSSVIDHSLRVKHDLTCEEYVVLESIHNNKTKYSDPSKDEEYIWKLLGFEYEHCMNIVERLMQKGYITSSNGSDLLVANIWKVEKDPLDQTFLELWNIFKKGSQPKAKEKYKSLIKKKVVTHEVLVNRRKKYIDWKESIGTEFQYIMSLEFWLTEKNRHWEDPLPIDSIPAKTVSKARFTDGN